jgi:hypothetical protein
MRRYVCLAALAALCAVGTAQAQSSVNWGPNITQTRNVIINTQAAMTAIQQSEAANLPIAAPMYQDNSFKLSSIFPKFGNANSKPVSGMTLYPTRNQLPNSSYLQAFGYQPPANQGFFRRFWHKFGLMQ